MKISTPPDWRMSGVADGYLVTPTQGGNNSMFIFSAKSPSNNLEGYVSNDIQNLQNSVFGTVDIVNKQNTVISRDFATVLHFIFKDSKTKDYVTEHQKTYLKHGDKIYVFDYTPSRKSFQRYLEGANAIVSSAEFSSGSSALVNSKLLSSTSSDTMSAIVTIKSGASLQIMESTLFQSL
jgi:hypothetical protein